jgi:3-oxoadipate enol-lactonase
MNYAIPDAELHYIDPNHGGTRPVLLLHGLGSDSSSWQLQIDALVSHGLRPIALDLPGFGKSTCKWNAWSLKYCAKVCDQLMENLSINSYDVVGISMGGVVAQLMSITYPSRVKRLVLINTFACLRPQKLDEWYYLLNRFLIAKIRGKNEQARLVAYRLFPAPDQEFYRNEIIRQIHQADSNVYQKALKSLGLLDIRKMIPSIQNKTLVITAELDTTVPVKNQQEMARLIPGSHQIFIKNSHHAVIVDQPEEVNSALVEFLCDNRDS